MVSRRSVIAGSCAIAFDLAGASRALGLEGADPPHRIVAINPAMVETVVALGAIDRLVGIGGKVAYPEDVLTLPSVGGALGFSVEAVLALNPDLVIMAVGTDGAAQLTRPLTEFGTKVFLASYYNFESILGYMRLMGDALDMRRNAKRLTDGMREKVAGLERRLQGKSRPTVYLETGAAGAAAFQTVRSGHYADDAIRLAGGRNIFGITGAPQVTLEGIAASDPDRIIVLASDATLTADAICKRPGWTALRAVREKRVSVIPRGFMLIPGPRQADAISILAREMHPEVFA